MANFDKHTSEKISRKKNSTPKAIPLWLVLLILLAGSLTAVFFAGSVHDSMKKKANGGTIDSDFQTVLLDIAKFPGLVTTVFTDLWDDTFNSEKFVSASPAKIPLDDFHPLQNSKNFALDALLVKADVEAMAANPGWRVLVGAFSINEEITNAALLLNPDLEVVQLWKLTEEWDGELKPRVAHRKFPHGFAFLSDGSIVFSFDGGVTMQRFDRCGERLWATEGNFHHSITLTDDEKHVWALKNDPGIVKVNTATGKVDREFTVDDIIKANPDIDLLAIRTYTDQPTTPDNPAGWNPRNETKSWMLDPYHLNDVEPLPEQFVSYFNNFSSGDLLISSRNLNLLMVIDPSSLKVKWWRIGQTSRQHDPDWGKGSISIFDNRMYSNYSNITSITPDSLNSEFLFQGENNDFYSRIRGKHQILENGNILITSSQQGRFFEVTQDGETVFEAISRSPDYDDRNFITSQAIFIPAEDFLLGEKDFVCKTKE